MDETALKERLLKENEEFRKAYEKHRELENKLIEYRAKAFLTEEEKIREKEMKKEKLLLKDRMYILMKTFKESLS